MKSNTVPLCRLEYGVSFTFGSRLFVKCKVTKLVVSCTSSDKVLVLEIKSGAILAFAKTLLVTPNILKGVK